ncbi:MAG: fibrobacter succinogenes major paralogous domain-containing protein [Fibrobacter sp.]|nr:fibrobacter succinogenes major paralogous domain-containing protein [Fibrobacter sp.]
MKKLFLELSFAALCAALLSACSSGSGTNSEPLEISSNSSSGADLFAETFDDLPVCTVNREGAIAYVKDEKAAYACEGGDWTLDDEDSTERKSNGDTDNDGKSSASEKPESSGSEGVEGSSASVPGGSSDASVYDADKNTLKDLRDGQIYKTTTIDIPSKSYSEVWMAENLNYAYTGVSFDYKGYTSDSTSWCYENAPANCAKYGRLYTWAAAMDSVGEWSTNGKGCGYGKECSVTSPVRGICPEGWHLPSRAEWDALFTAVGGSSTAGSKLKFVTGWNAYSGITNEDAFGFSALPAGGRYDDGGYDDEGDDAYFWSSTEDESDEAYVMRLYDNKDEPRLYNLSKYNGFSVRCLKD